MRTNKQQPKTRLKNKFDFRRPRNGELVITAEIHRVTNANWGRQNGDGYHSIEVETLHPKGGRHIMYFGKKMGQQGVMILKRFK